MQQNVVIVKVVKFSDSEVLAQGKKFALKIFVNIPPQASATGTF